MITPILCAMTAANNAMTVNNLSTTSKNAGMPNNCNTVPKSVGSTFPDYFMGINKGCPYGVTVEGTEIIF